MIKSTHQGLEPTTPRSPHVARPVVHDAAVNISSLSSRIKRFAGQFIPTKHCFSCKFTDAARVYFFSMLIDFRNYSCALGIATLVVTMANTLAQGGPPTAVKAELMVVKASDFSPTSAQRRHTARQ